MRSRAQSGPVGVAAVALLMVLVRGSGAPLLAAEGDPATLDVAPPLREHDQAGDRPTISIIDSQTPTCSRAEPLSETCYVEWSYHYVTADAGQYILDLTVELGGRLRAVYQGFFQTYMYVPADMHDGGFAVACGHPGVGGDPARGNAWYFVIRARETSGQAAANYGTVFCPYTLHIFSDDLESGDISRWSAHLP